MKATRPPRNLTTPGRQSVMRVLTAVGVVVMVHVFIFGLIKAEAPTQKVRHRTWPKVYLFPIDEPPATHVQRDLLEWMDLFDPTILSLPSEVRGFSRVRIGEFVPPTQEATFWPVTVGRADMPTLGAAPLTVVTSGLAPAAMRLNAVSPPELPARARYTPPKIEPGIYWLLPSGEAISDPPVVDVSTAGAVVQRPTILSALIAEGNLRARVETSCGDRTLDLAALSALRQWLGISGKNLTGGVKPDKDGVLSLSVQWRFAEGVQLGHPSLETPVWNGEDWRDLHWR